MDILFRLGIALLIIVAGILAYRAMTFVRLAILRRERQSKLGNLDWQAGTPAILYFTTPDCAPCKTIQGPAVATLQQQFGDRLQIIKIDAAQQTQLADAWGVLSVPTTFIIDAEGQPRHVNNGVAPAPKLRQQLREFAGLDDSPGRGSRVSSHASVRR